MPVRRVLALAVLLVALVAAAPAFAEAGITSIWEPGKYNQLEVFWVNDRGAIETIWKDQYYYWFQPKQITHENVAVPGSELKAVWSTMNDQLEVYWVDGAGALNVVWKDHNGAWKSPMTITGPGFAVPGSPITAFWQPEYHQMHIFGITGDGSIDAVYKVDNKNYNPPTLMTFAGAAVPGSQPVALYQPTGGQSQLFYTAPNGSVNLMWKAYNENWHRPFPVTAPGVTAPGAWLTASYYPPYDQLEVFYTNPSGAANVTWKHGTDINAWTTQTITGANFSPPGAPITVGFVPADNHLEVFSTGSAGTVNDVWKQNNGAWQPAFDNAGPGSTVPGNTVSATTLPNPLQLEVFYQDAKGAIWDAWKKSNEPWQPPVRLTNDNGKSIVTKDYCMAYWRNWYTGRSGRNDWLALDCKGYAAGVCRWWHLTSPPMYLQNNNDYWLLVMYSRERDMDFPNKFQEKIDANGNNRFGGHILYYYQVLGAGSDDTGQGDLGGNFNVYTGSLRFNTNQWKKHAGDGTWRTLTYNGHLLEIGRSPEGHLVASMEGGVYYANGISYSSWFAPGARHPWPLWCEDSDVMIGDTPPGPARNRIPELPVKPKPGATFNGWWSTRTQNGVIYNLMLKQDAAGNVTGDYTFGKISKGVVVDRDLYAVWTQGSSSGTLKFHLAPDGTTFAGIWQNTDTKTKPGPGNVTGTWDGYSVSQYTKADKTGEFNGKFLLDKNPGERVDLNIAVKNQKVGGSFPGGAFLGTVKSPAGQPTEFDGVFVLGKYLFGKGSLFFYPNGKGFSGFWHVGKTAYMYAWSGWFEAPPPPPGPDDLVQYGGCACGPDEKPPVAAPAQPTPPPAQPPVAKPPVVPTPPPAAPVAVTPPSPKPIVLPQGQCPAPTATATQQLNIRIGSNGDVVSQVAGGSRLQCLACDANWCLIASNNPNTTVSRKYLQFDMPEAVKPTPAPEPDKPAPPPEQPAPAPVPVQPEPAAPAPEEVANFDGHWNVYTSTGLVEQFDLHQQGAVVVGSYVDTQSTMAQVTGGVSGKTLTLQWVNNRGYSGAGFFTMHDDKQSFDGKFGVSNIPPFQQMPIYMTGGTWQTFVPQPAAPAPDTTPDDLTQYGGCSSCNADPPTQVVK